MRVDKAFSLALCSLVLAVFIGPAVAGRPSETYAPSSGPYINDRKITIRTAADAAARREALIGVLWGAAGFPSAKLPSAVQTGVASPVRGLSNLERVDELRISMGGGLVGMSHHFIPRNNKLSRLAILHLGHTDSCSFNDGFAGEPDFGMRNALNRLLEAGYPVLAVYMPQVTPEDCRWQHDKIFTIATPGSPMKFFLEPTLVSLNYLEKRFPRYSDYTMIGLSGGGWTTTLYAALDQRIRVSIPVAGSLPLYLSHAGYGYDIEQRLDSFYRLAGYPDLYLLGVFGTNRKQIQILNRHDDCCFGEMQHDPRLTGKPFEPSVRDYERRVQKVAKTPGFGSFRVVIDEQSDGHKISSHALSNIILPELRRSTPPTGNTR